MAFINNTRQHHSEEENAAFQKSDKLWERSIHSLFDNFPDPVFLLDRDFIILAANHAFCIQVGKSIEQCLNTNCFDILPFGLAKTKRQKLEDVLASGKPIFFEDEQNGRILRSSLYPVNDGAGQILVFVQNVTEAKRIELKLKSQDTFNQALIKSIPGIFYIVDRTGQIVSGNDYLREKIIGDPKSDFAGINVLDLLHPDDREQGREVLKRLIDKNSPEELFEGRVLCQGGPLFRWYVTTACNAIIDGSHYIIGIGIDITSHKESEKALCDSEERFRKLFESHAAPKMVIDSVTGSIIDANQAAAEFYGWKVEELKEMNINQIIIHSDEEIKQQQISCRHRTADGSIRDVEVYSNKIEIKGKFLIYAIIIDVTDRKRLEALTDGMITTDRHGTITGISPMGIHLFGVTKQSELLARPFVDLVHSRDTRKWQAILQEKPDKTASRSLELLCKKGKEATFLAEITALPIHDFAGALQSHQLIIRDITQKKLIESKQQQTRSLIELGEMASGVAHEITQPINTISLLVDKMLEDAKKDRPNLKDAVTRQAKKIIQNIARMQSIVDNIRLFGSSNQKNAATLFDSRKPVNSALNLISRECAKKSIQLNFKFGPEELPVKGNFYKLEQVILNLIGNSIDALEEKRQHNALSTLQLPTADSYIHIHAKRQKENVIISVEDNGIGISQQNIDYILQPFFTTKESGKGTGLGLSISSRIIKEMQGQLNIKSTPMQGTTVQLTLPLGHHDDLPD